MNEKNFFSVFIAEDEQPARDLLIEYILACDELKLDGWAKDGEEALNKLSCKTYDILFLDINLPLMTGIEVLENLKEFPYVIFTTAYDNYAVRAFEMGAIDYLLKPFPRERFEKAVDKAIRSIEGRGRKMSSISQIGLSVKEEGNHYIIPHKEIMYVSSRGRNSRIHRKERIYECPQSLKELESFLPGDFFIRIHKQVIINITHVSHLQYLIGGQYVAFLKDDPQNFLTVGRMYVPDLKKLLKF